MTADARAGPDAGPRRQGRRPRARRHPGAAGPHVHQRASSPQRGAQRPRAQPSPSAVRLHHRARDHDRRRAAPGVHEAGRAARHAPSRRRRPPRTGRRSSTPCCRASSDDAAQPCCRPSSPSAGRRVRTEAARVLDVTERAELRDTEVAQARERLSAQMAGEPVRRGARPGRRADRPAAGAQQLVQRRPHPAGEGPPGRGGPAGRREHRPGRGHRPRAARRSPTVDLARIQALGLDVQRAGPRGDRRLAAALRPARGLC